MMDLSPVQWIAVAAMSSAPLCDEVLDSVICPVCVVAIVASSGPYGSVALRSGWLRSGWGVLPVAAVEVRGRWG